MSNNLRCLGFERGHAAGAHYRLVQPLYKMLENNLANILTIHEGNASDLNFVVDKIIESDVIVFQRPADDKWLNFIKVAQKHGKSVVVDYDDDPFSTHPLNPSYQWYGIENVSYTFADGTEKMLWQDGEAGFNIETNLQRRFMFRANFKKADMVTCTTDILKNTLSKINPNTVVLPNLIDFNIFHPVEMVKKEIRIGWQGGFSHYHDLYMVAPAIKKIIKKYDNVKFVFFGDMGFQGLFKDIPEDKIEWVNWVQHVAYPYKLMTLNIDIGLCPIIDDQFNRSKSSLKYLEYSALKIPTIASNIPPYNVDITDGENGILVGDDKWYEAIEELVNNEEKRRVIANNAYDNVRENHCASKFSYLWKDSYMELLNKDISDIC